MVARDQALQADVAAHLQAALIAGQKKLEPGDAAIAIAKRMNAEKIQIERAGEYQRMNPFLHYAALPKLNHFRHRRRRLSGGHRFETHAAAAMPVGLDDVHVLFLVTAAVPDFAATAFA